MKDSLIDHLGNVLTTLSKEGKIKEYAISFEDGEIWSCEKCHRFYCKARSEVNRWRPLLKEGSKLTCRGLVPESAIAPDKILEWL